MKTYEWPATFAARCQLIEEDLGGGKGGISSCVMIDESLEFLYSF